jgi:hypothetical protein
MNVTTHQNKSITGYPQNNRSDKMTKLFRKVKQSISRHFNKVARQATKTFNSEVEEIVNKTLATEEIEEIVIQAVERVMFSLVRRYWLAVVVLLLFCLGLQSIF